MKTTKRLFLLGLMLGYCLISHAQIESHLTYRLYTTQDGLPQMQAERLWQDSKGYIYMGTLSGFVRFDGRVLTPFLKGRRMNIVGLDEIDGEVVKLSDRPDIYTLLQSDSTLLAFASDDVYAVGTDSLKLLATAGCRLRGSGREQGFSRLACEV